MTYPFQIGLGSLNTVLLGSLAAIFIVLKDEWGGEQLQWSPYEVML